MDRLQVVEKMVDDGLQRLNESVISKFETMDRHAHGLGVDVQASATRTECSSLLVKKEQRKFIAEQLQDLKEFIQFQGLTRDPTREGEASEGFHREKNLTGAPGMNRLWSSKAQSLQNLRSQSKMPRRKQVMVMNRPMKVHHFSKKIHMPHWTNNLEQWFCTILQKMWPQ